ncbi:MAG: hypothetical protein AAGG75_02045 [Bacteroidota bacterium]
MAIRKTKFFSLFRDLSERERKAFVDYINANHSAKLAVVKLVNYLAKNLTSIDQLDKSRAEVFKALFNDDSSQAYRKIGNALSDLYLLFEEFLLWKTITREQLPERDFLLLDIFRKRGDDGLYQQKLNHLERQLQKEKEQNIWSYFRQMKWYHCHYFFSDIPKLAKGESSIQLAMQQLDAFYVAAKFRYACELKSREAILQEKHQIEFLPQLLAHCQSEDFYHTPYFEIYQLTLQLIHSQKEEDYQLLKEKFFEYASVFDAPERASIFSYLFNYMASTIKKGHTAVAEETFLLYKRGLEEWIFIENNYMPHTRFNNIINIACKLKEYDWATAFIDRWQYYLEANIRSSAVGIGRARLLFEQAAYQQAITLLGTIDFSNSFYTIRAKVLLLRCHYELETDQSVLHHMSKAFENYIRRNRLIHLNTQLLFLNFAKAMNCLVDMAKSQKSKVAYVQSLQPLVYKDWLLSKVNE